MVHCKQSFKEKKKGDTTIKKQTTFYRCIFLYDKSCSTCCFIRARQVVFVIRANIQFTDGIYSFYARIFCAMHVRLFYEKFYAIVIRTVYTLACVHTIRNIIYIKEFTLHQILCVYSLTKSK